MRTLLSTLLIGVPVMLILTLVGVTQGFMEDSRQRSMGTGADVIFRPPGSSYGTGSGAPMSMKMVEWLANQPHVRIATPVVQATTGKLFNILTGIDVDAFNRMSGGFVYLEGRPMSGAHEILVDADFAAEQKLKPGSKTKLLNTIWTVAGVVKGGKLSHVFCTIADLQEVTGDKGVSQIYLKLDDPKNADAVVDALKEQRPDHSIYSMSEWVSFISPSNISGLSAFIDVTIGIGVVTGFFVVLMSMYMAVLQRTREIGILKSLGATNGFVMSLILWEAGVAGLGGTVVGIALSFATKAVLKNFVAASLPPAIVPLWWPIAGGIAIGAAFLGAIYPGIIAIRQDPIEALAYE